MPWLNLRLAGYVVAALAAAGLAWRVMAWRSGYLQRDAAVAELKTERDGRAADRTQYAQQVAASEASRQALQSDLTKIKGKFSAIPPVAPKDLTTTIEVPRGTSETCPSPRLSPQFLSVFNAQAAP